MASVPATPSTSALGVISMDIKIAHSIFAMPFALLASFMAASFENSIDWNRFAWQLLVIVLAMVFARTAAMLANRILDRNIDADNPRTAGRALPSGRLTLGTAMSALAIASGGFIATCLVFGLAWGNWWPLVLCLPVLGWITSYGLFKRFSSLCHLWLGTSLGISPVAAAIAIDPASLGEPSIWLIAGMVTCWVSGFDIIYALQDEAVDREAGLHSIPARLGTDGALWVSRLLHLAAIACLVMAGVLSSRFGLLFMIGVGIVGLTLAYEQFTVRRWGMSRIAMAFFTCNGIISCVLGGLGIADIIINAG